MSRSTGIDNLTAALLSQAASFPVHAPPAGWTALPEYSYSTVPSLSIGINSFTTFVNIGTKQIVIAFQGTDFGNYVFGPPQLMSDLADEGYAAWESLAPTFLSYLSQIQINTDYAGYEVMTDGHSLGGGLAQTAALEFGLSGYGQNSLPVSKLAIQNDTQITQQGGFQNALAAWQAAGNTFSEVNTAGDPATNLFTGQAYISTSTTTLANPYSSIEAYGAAVAGISGSGNNTYVPPLLVEVGEGIAAYGELNAHAIATVINALQNNATSTAAQSLKATESQQASPNATPLLNSQPTLTAAETSFALTAFASSTSTLNSDGSVEITESDGLGITLSNTGFIVPSTLQSGQDFIYRPGSSYNFLMAGSDLTQYLGSSEALFAVDPTTDNILAFEQSTSSKSGIIQISTQSGGGLAVDGGVNDDLNIMAGVAGSTIMQSIFDFSEDGQDGDTVYLSYTSNGDADLTLDLGSGDTTDISVDDSLASVVQDFSFSGDAGDLELTGTNAFTGTISDFQPGDTIDLLGISATGGTLTSNSLNIQREGGSALTLNIANSAAPQNVYAILDGNGGTNIVLTEPVPVTTAPTSETVIGGLVTDIGGLSVAVPNGPAINETITVVLSDSAGILAASQTDGSTVTGSGTTNMTISGSLDAVSSDLNSVNYIGPDTTGNSTDVINLVTKNDQGNGDLHQIAVTEDGISQKTDLLIYTYSGTPIDEVKLYNTQSLLVPVGESISGRATINVGADLTPTLRSFYAPYIFLTDGTTTYNGPAYENYSYDFAYLWIDANENIVYWGVSAATPGYPTPASSALSTSSTEDVVITYGGTSTESTIAGDPVYPEEYAYTTLSGSWSAPTTEVISTLTPLSGQTLQLSNILAGVNNASQSVQDLAIAGAGVVDLTGVAAISNVVVNGGASLLVQNGILNTDPITIDAAGNLSGFGTVTGDATINGTATAIGGTLDITGNVSGSGTLVIDGSAALLLEGTVAATEGSSFSGIDEFLIVGTASSVLSSIFGFAAGDFIEIEGEPVTAAAYSTITDELALTASSGAEFTLDLSGTYQPSDFAVSDGELVDYALCFLDGTRIRTPEGETPIEDLKIGDLVLTGAGDPKPIRWIGRRSYDGRFIAGNHLALPVCIKQNAIAGRVPARDLDVSPGHGIFVGDVLVPAWRLVNGVSITQAESVQSVRYINVELESHELILANNCPAETFLNIGDFRDQFQNADEFKKLYPDDDGEPGAFIPRLEEGFKLHAIQGYLAGRAGIVMPAEVQGDIVHGFVDEAGPHRVRGWVQCVHKPEAPVCVDIWMGGSLVARSLANGYRADLRKAGLGSGCHGFDIPLPIGLSGRVRVQRTIDQAELVLGGAAELRVA